MESENFQDWLAGIAESKDQSSDIVEKKAYTLDLFNDVLPALDRGDKKYYSRLTAEEQKSISPWLLMRWMTSAQHDADQPACLITVNTLVNHNFSHLSPKSSMGKEGHAELQWMLLSMCGSGNTRRKFIKPGKAHTKDRLEEALLKFYPCLRSDELELLTRMNSQDDLVQFFKDNGFDDKTIKEIFK